jgi:hypothetical protein
MNVNIKEFLNLIRNCSVDNTYKMAWAKAIAEISSQERKSNVIYLEQIAKKMFKYYWNQTIYFDLIQGSNLSKPPEFIKEVKKEIEKYYVKIGKRQPIHFERVESEIILNTKVLIKILKQDVSWRFLKLNNAVIKLYDYNKGDDFLIIKNPELIADYAEIIYESVNFRWTQILENFNSSPRIAKKVRVLDLPEVKRASLTRFRAFLDVENQGQICFICNKTIINETPSIDHLIPWSFLYSDDLWNLVYTHRSCNSMKSNIIPTEFQIVIIEERNKNLHKLLLMNESLKNKKPTEELEIAIDRDFIRKFWINCKN